MIIENKRLELNNYNAISIQKPRKTLALLSGRSQKYEYFTGKRMLPPGPSKMI